MEHISADELHSRVENLSSEDLILDVRSPSEFNDGHIEGAQNTLHEEVTNEVMDGKQSVVWLEALNRVHAQKSIIEWCLK